MRNLEEIAAERGISIDNATIPRWVVRYSPELLKRFNALKRNVTGRWHVDETYIKVRGRWIYLYRAIDSNGDTVEFCFSERRNLTAAKRFLRKALKRRGRPERLVIDVRIRQSAYLNNWIEQDHRAIKPGQRLRACMALGKRLLLAP